MKFFYKNCEALFVFSNEILSNVAKYNVEELNFPWEKTPSHFSYDFKFAIKITIIHFAICKVPSDNLNPVLLNPVILKSLIRETAFFRSSFIAKTFNIVRYFTIV